MHVHFGFHDGVADPSKQRVKALCHSSSAAIQSQQTDAKSCNPEPCKEESSAHIDILVTAVAVAALTRQLRVLFGILRFWILGLGVAEGCRTSTVSDVCSV